MAKAPQQPAPQQPVPFPRNWSKMSPADKLKWQSENRPGFNAAARSARPPQPMPAPIPPNPNALPEPNADYSIPPDDDYATNAETWEEGEESRVRAIVAKMLHELADHLTGGNTGL